MSESAKRSKTLAFLNEFHWKIWSEWRMRVLSLTRVKGKAFPNTFKSQLHLAKKKKEYLTTFFGLWWFRQQRKDFLSKESL